ncbi:MAG: ATP-binding protein [Halanaerobium sp.]|nr:ATP-binding protein [Halanaerobium sp.]
MRELSLHILDLVENSIKAGAEDIRIEIIEDSARDILEILLADNGRGMDEEMVKRVCDPFVTSRKERKVGLGLSLIKAAAQRCQGDFKLSSQPGKGTSVEVSFKHSHIDRAPLGDMAATLFTIVQASPELDLHYYHRVNDREFTFELADVRDEMAGMLTHPRVLNFLYDFFQEKIKVLRQDLI